MSYNTRNISLDAAAGKAATEKVQVSTGGDGGCSADGYEPVRDVDGSGCVGLMLICQRRGGISRG